MAYFYVKDGGTALTATDDGRYASQQTGSFATLGVANYYTSLKIASEATTPPTAGDIICCSNVSAATAVNETTINGGTTVSAVPLVVMSVSDTAMDTYSTGFTETLNSSWDYIFSGMLSLLGLDLTVGDDMTVTPAGTQLDIYDCILRASGSADEALRVHQEGVTVNLYNTSIGASNASSQIIVMVGGALTLVNCTVHGTANAELITYTATRNGTVICKACDFSPVAHTQIISNDSWNSITADDTRNVKLYNCAMNASTAFYGTAPTSRDHQLLAVNTGSSAAAREYQYFYVNGWGTVEDETGFYRNGSTAFPSGQKISLKVITVATGPDRSLPFAFDFPTRYAELSDTNSDTLSIYILSSAALDDGDVWAEVYYTDATLNAPNAVTSVAQSYDPFRTPGALTTNTQGWTGRTTENRYQIDLDTSGDVGADCVPVIRVYVAKASATIYFCPSVELF